MASACVCAPIDWSVVLLVAGGGGVERKKTRRFLRAEIVFHRDASHGHGVVTVGKKIDSPDSVRRSRVGGNQAQHPTAFT